MAKGWAVFAASGFGRFVKGLFAIALCLGTIGASLLFVDVAPVSAATPTLISLTPTSGLPAGGAKVVITGTAFSTTVANDVVDFGPGNPATVSSATAGKITINAAPPGSGTVNVTVTVSGVAATGSLTYTYEGVPTVTALYSANGPTTGGTTIIIAGTNLLGATAVNFANVAATSFTVNSATNISAVVPALPNSDNLGTTYYVTVVTGSGTSAQGPGSAWYWFGSGTCTMSGPGVQNSGAPPGASAYVLNATQAVGGSTGTTVAGSTTFTDPNASFKASEVGQTIEIINAGAPTVQTGYTTPDGFTSTIASVVSPTQVTLAAAPEASITGSAQWDLTSLATGSDGTTTASSTTFTTTGADFSAGDVGDTIDITGAGASGNSLVTKIDAVVSSSQITLDTAASTAVSGNAAWAIYNTTVIGTACTGLGNLQLASPMIESLSDPEASVTTGTGPNGGPGGNETFLGWSGQNDYFTITPGGYDAGYVLPYSGPNTTGGCPLSGGILGTCGLAQSNNEAAFFGTDPQGTCPPTQEEANAGLVQCSLAALAANETGNSYIVAGLDVAYANDPTPANPTTAITPSTGLSAGQTVTVNACSTCNWWGAGSTGAPGYASPAGSTGKATAIPAPTVFMGATRATAVPVTNSTVAITPANYNCGTSGGAALSPPGPVATCVLGTAPVTNSTGTVNSGSTTLSDPAGNFTSKNVGQAIAVQGAGASGGTLITTITAVTSASQLTMGTAASTSIAGSALYTYGVSKEGTTGTTTASTKPIACPTTGTVPASCTFTDPSAHFTSSDLNKAITVYGAGPASSPLTTSILKVNSATSVELGFEATTAIAGTAGYTYGTMLQGSTGTATANSTTFTDANASFVSGQVGDDIVITGAGASGTALVTTIAAVNSSTSITLGTKALTSVAGSANYAYGTPSQGTITGTFTVPAGLTCGSSCNVYIDEPDTTLTPGNYSGTGSYNVGLAYNLVNAVEGTAAASCSTGCGGGGSTAPTVTSLSPTNGPAAGGTSVTVTGTNLSGATAVKFGSTSVTTGITNNTATSLTVTSPAGTGVVDITVTTPNGTSAANPPGDQFTYNAAPPPTVTSLSPTNGPAAGGTSVTVTGTNLSGATAVKFGSTSVTTGITNNTATSLTVTSPAGTGTVDVTVVTPNGTSAANPPGDQFIYNAAPPPPTVTSLSPTNGPAAGGTSVTVTGTNLSGATAVKFGSTSVTTGITNNTATSLTVTSPAGTGVVDITVTTPNGTSAANPPGDQFTYNGPPSVTSVSPDNGAQAGGNTVTVNGSNFLGTTTVHFGTTAVTTGISNITATSLSVVVPAGAPGTVDVTVTTANGTSPVNSPSDEYTYTAAPTVTSVSPDNGPQGGTNLVTVNGSGFSGTPTVTFGSTQGTNVTNVTANSLSVTVPAGTGTVSVTVTTTAGGASTPLTNAYTYNPPPTVTSLSPTNGPAAGGTSVTVTGTNLSGATAVKFGSTSVTTGITNNTATSLTVTSPAGTGTVDVTVVTPNGTSAANPPGDQFIYNPAPTVTSVSPTNGAPAGGTSVTVTGTNLSGATAVKFGSTSVTTGITNNTATSLTVTSPAGTGVVDITVTTPNGTSAANPPGDQFTYNGPPSVTSVSPDNGAQAGGNTVTVNGSNFLGTTTVHFGTTAVTTGISNITATSLSVVVPAGAPGTVDVTVTTANGTSPVNSPSDEYTYTAAPTVTSVSPDNGPQGGTNLVTVNGSGFSGTPTVTFGSTQGTNVTNVTANSLSVTVPAGTGTVSVTVTTTAGGASTPLTNAYTYNPPPTVTSLSPTNGPAAGGTSVTVTGTNLSGATAVKFGSTSVTTGITNNTATSLTVTSPAGTGTVDVTVVTPNGTSAANPPGDQFIYNPAPTVTSVSPTNGAPAGGTSVTVTGTNLSGATAVKFGSTSVTTGITNNTATSLTVTSPAGTGVVDITVTTPNGTSAANPPGDQFTYNGPPSVTSVSPDNGAQAGGNTVTVNGSNFLGTTTVHFGTTAVTTGISNITATSLSVVVPAGAPGTVDVTVTTANGTSPVNSPSDEYTYTAAPTVTGVSPTSGPAGGGTLVTVTGNNLTGATAVKFGSLSGTGITSNTGTSLTVTSPVGTGTVDITVTTPSGTSASSASDEFTYNARPTVTGVTPNNGPPSGTNTVSVSGSGFVSGSTTVAFGPNAGTNVSVVNSSSLWVTVPAGTGTVSVTVSTTAGGSSTPLPSAYTYNAPPIVTGVSPNSGSPSGGTSVTLTGTGFTGATAVDFGPSNLGSSLDVTSSTRLTVTSPPGSGTVDVSVTTPNGTGTKSSAFTYALLPTITKVSPIKGTTLGGTTVTIKGTNLASPTSVTFGGNAGTVATSSATSIKVTTPTGTAGAVDVVVTTSSGSATDASAYTYVAPAVVTKPSTTQGYWEVAADGGIFNFGGAGYYGSTGSSALNAPIVGMASTPDGNGYWLVARDGGIFGYGDAHFYGSRGGQPLNAPIVGMASTPDGGGYWLVAKDGGIFAYGDAQFFGSRGGQALNAPIVGMAATSDGNGYWLVASDGGIFSYGDAHFFGSRGGQPLNAPIVGMASAPGSGYWLVGRDGGLFAYGDAQFYGSASGMSAGASVVGMAATPDGGGYWLVAGNGDFGHYGDATSTGTASTTTLNAPIVGISAMG